MVLTKNRKSVANNISRTDLISFFIEYIKTHTYFKSRRIALTYLKTHMPSNYDNHTIGALTRKISRLVITLKRLGYVSDFSTYTFKSTKTFNAEKLAKILL